MESMIRFGAANVMRVVRDEIRLWNRYIDLVLDNIFAREDPIVLNYKQPPKRNSSMTNLFEDYEK